MLKGRIGEKFSIEIIEWLIISLIYDREGNREREREKEEEGNFDDRFIRENYSCRWKILLYVIICTFLEMKLVNYGSIDSPI